jgi:predicted transcriptional regulator
MSQPYRFEASLAIVLIVLGATAYFMVSTGGPTISTWEYDGSGRVQYMTVGNNDTLYAFKSDAIYAIDQKGDLAWSYQVPGKWKVLNNWERPIYAAGGSAMTRAVDSYPVTDTANGYLYVFALPNATIDQAMAASNRSSSPYLDIDAAVLAISPAGKLAWELPLKVKINANDIIDLTNFSDLRMTRSVAIRAHGDRVYVFHDYTETAVSSDGTVLFEIANVAGPASVDEKGTLYLVEATRPSDAEPGLRPGELPYDPVKDPDYRVPSGKVIAYDANGSLAWEKTIQGTIASQYVAEDIWSRYNSLPLYQNGTVYVPLTNGIVALDEKLQTRWWKYIQGGTSVLFDLMPIDSQGNVYMKELNPASSSSYLYKIGPDGLIHSAPWKYDSRYDGLRRTAADEGIVYNVNNDDFIAPRSIYSLCTEVITAYGAGNGTPLWSYTMPVDDKYMVTVNESNVGDLLKGIDSLNDTGAPGWNSPLAGTAGKAAQQRSIIGWPEISIYPGSDILYVSFRSTNVERPVVYNQSRAVYSGGIYALDNHGELVWGKPLSGLVTSATANNSTIYYSTADGKIFGTRVDMAVGGIALLASLAIFFKFFVFGTVSRARDRLDKNDNRNMVLSYIGANPGVTAVDIARDMHLNVGTVRYHLLILSINHKIVEHKDDKYLRYFTNSNSYSLAERAIISLMKREPMWRVLNVLAEKPGLSNVEISKELSISTGAASRHMNELLSKGIVDKLPQGDRGYAYSIKGDYKEYVTRVMDRL